MISKQREKQLIAEAFAGLVAQAGPDSYISQIFSADLLAAVCTDIDRDFIFSGFAEMQAEKAKWQAEINDINAIIQERTKYAEQVERRVIQAHKALARMREDISDMKTAVLDLDRRVKA